MDIELYHPSPHLFPCIFVPLHEPFASLHICEYLLLQLLVHSLVDFEILRHLISPSVVVSPGLLPSLPYALIVNCLVVLHVVLLRLKFL